LTQKVTRAPNFIFATVVDNNTADPDILARFLINLLLLRSMTGANSFVNVRII